MIIRYFTKSNKLPVDAGAAGMGNILAVSPPKASRTWWKYLYTCASKKGMDGGWEWGAEGGLSWVPGWLLRKLGEGKII